MLLSCCWSSCSCKWRDHFLLGPTDSRRRESTGAPSVMVCETISCSSQSKYSQSSWSEQSSGERRNAVQCMRPREQPSDAPTLTLNLLSNNGKKIVRVCEVIIFYRLCQRVHTFSYTESLLRASVVIMSMFSLSNGCRYLKPWDTELATTCTSTSFNRTTNSSTMVSFVRVDLTRIPIV